MATMVIPSAVSDWQHEAARQAAELCAKVLAVEQEKENAKNDKIENCSSPLIEEKSKVKVEPITDFMRKQFEILVEQRNCNIYPTRNEKEEIAQLLDASYSQINRLFANHRRRILKKKVTPQTEIREASIERLMAKIKEPFSIVTPGEILLHEETSTSERSVSPTGSFSETDESVAVICAQVADQIHDDIQGKKNSMQIEKREKQPRKKRAPKRKVSEHDAKLEATVDEILSKVSREEIDAEREQQGQIIASSPLIDSATTSFTLPTSNPNLSEMSQNILNMIVNDVITRPPDLPQSLMADVNPKLVEAMRLLDEGVSWTHPAILSVLVLIRQHAQATALLNQYQQQQQQQSSPNSEHYSSPAPESVTSRSSEKSTEELMRSLTPDEYLAVNVLTEMADAF